MQVRLGCCLFFVLGLSCWWMLIGLSLEIPALLSAKVPEGKNIAIDLNLACQAGNVPVLLYLLVPAQLRPKAKNTILALSLMLLASTVCTTQKTYQYLPF